MPSTIRRRSQPGPHQTVLEDAGLVVIPNWATAIANGPAAATDEVNQTRNFAVTIIQTEGNLVFTTAPAVSPNEGHLTFQTAPDTNGLRGSHRATAGQRRNGPRRR